MPTTRTRGTTKAQDEEGENEAKRMKVGAEGKPATSVPVPPLPDDSSSPSAGDTKTQDPLAPTPVLPPKPDLQTAVPTPLNNLTTTNTEETPKKDTTAAAPTPATVTTDDASKTAAAIASVGGGAAVLDEKHQAEINAALEKVKEEALRNTPSISTIVTEGLWDDDAKKVEESLTELANLSFGHANAGPNRVTISLTGGLLAIVKALTKHADDAEVQAAGGRALQNLALDQNNKGGIASAGGIEVLVTAMKKFRDDPAVQLGGCGSFQNLVWGNDDNRTRILKAGAIPEIIMAMNNHTEFPELQEWACGALYLLSVGEAEVKEAILESRGLSAIAKAIEDNKEDGGIREKGRNAMARLLWP